jgi:four helix bundle protein
MGNYRRLEVWQLAHKLAVEVYHATAAFPPQERFGPTAQLRRSVISVSSNIAEGSGRGSPAELRRFISIARGSLHEAASQLAVSRALGFLPDGEWQAIDLRMDRISRMLFGLSRRQ